MGGLDTEAELEGILASETLPGVMPTDWILATMEYDKDNDGSSTYASAAGWTLRLKRLAPRRRGNLS
ncbi:hypothetical protein SB748_25595 [Rhizobium sp. SIMBA_035]